MGDYWRTSRADRASANGVPPLLNEENMVSRVLILAFSFIVLPLSTAGDEPFDYRAAWHAWPVAMQVGYVEGFVEGVSKASVDLFLIWLGKFGWDDRENVMLVTAEYGSSYGKFASFKLYEVVDELYKDPANSFVDRKEMIQLAIAKLQGNSVSDLLPSARKSAVVWHRVLQCLEMTEPIDRSNCLEQLRLEVVQ